MPLGKRVLYSSNLYGKSYTDLYEEHLNAKGKKSTSRTKDGKFESGHTVNYKLVEGLNMSSNLGILLQISYLSSYAAELFENMARAGEDMNERLKDLSGRTLKLMKHAPNSIQNIRKFDEIVEKESEDPVEANPESKTVDVAKFRSRRKIGNYIPSVIIKKTNSLPILDIYNTWCVLPPALWKLDDIITEILQMQEDFKVMDKLGQEDEDDNDWAAPVVRRSSIASTSKRKKSMRPKDMEEIPQYDTMSKFSNLGFFFEQWLQAEIKRQLKRKADRVREKNRRKLKFISGDATEVDGDNRLSSFFDASMLKDAGIGRESMRQSFDMKEEVALSNGRNRLSSAISVSDFKRNSRHSQMFSANIALDNTISNIKNISRTTGPYRPKIPLDKNYYYEQAAVRKQKGKHHLRVYYDSERHSEILSGKGYLSCDDDVIKRLSTAELADIDELRELWWTALHVSDNPEPTSEVEDVYDTEFKPPEPTELIEQQELEEIEQAQYEDDEVNSEKLPDTPIETPPPPKRISVSEETGILSEEFSFDPEPEEIPSPEPVTPPKPSFLSSIAARRISGGPTNIRETFTSKNVRESINLPPPDDDDDSPPMSPESGPPSSPPGRSASTFSVAEPQQSLDRQVSVKAPAVARLSSLASIAQVEDEDEPPGNSGDFLAQLRKAKAAVLEKKSNTVAEIINVPAPEPTDEIAKSGGMSSDSLLSQLTMGLQGLKAVKRDEVAQKATSNSDKQFFCIAQILANRIAIAGNSDSESDSDQSGWSD